MKTRLICSIALLLIMGLLFAEANPFTSKIDSKHEIVDSLLAVDELSGSIYYQQNYLTVDANWQEGQTYIGDYYDWGWMVRFASIGYLSFEVPIISVGYELQSASLRIYIQTWSGNNNGSYPIFDYGNTTVFPQGILEHVDYGDTFNSIDVFPSSVYSVYTFFDHETLVPPCWVSFDVTDCLRMSIDENMSLTQFRLYLNGFSDWDNREDYIVYDSYSIPQLPHSPKIVYTLSDGTSVTDPTLPQPQLAISCYPNPFTERSTISIKSSEPGFSKLNIYNIKGQLIRSYVNSSKSSGDHTFQWDGRDDTGKLVSGGIYIAVVESGRNRASSKIFYVK